MFIAVEASAQSRTSYFMEGSYFRTELNPALKPTRGYVALPGISGVGVNATSNFLSVDNLFYDNDGVRLSIFDGSMSASEVASRFPSEANLRLNANVNVLGVGFYSGKTFWNFGVNARVQSFATMPNDMFGSIAAGSVPSKITHSSYDSTSFIEAYFGSSFRVHRSVNLGFRLKALFGVMGVSGQMTSASRESLTGEYVVAGMCVNKSPQAPNYTPYDKTDVFRKDLGYMVEGDVNFGLALDFGAEVRLFNDHLRLSAAITDLGFIKWHKDRIKGVVVNTKFNFDGAGIEEVATCKDAEFTYVSNPYAGKDQAKNMRMLNFSVNAGIEYSFLRNHMSIGVMSHSEFCNNTIVLLNEREALRATKRDYHEITASLNLRPTNWLSATVSKTFLVGEDIDIFGVALNIHPRGINIFVGADFVDYKYIKGPHNSVLFSRPTSHNIYAGVGFNLTRPKYLREEAMAARAAKAERKAQRLSKRYSAN